MQPLLVSWPAIIKFDGDAELTFIRDQADWEQNAEYHHFQYQAGDTLIDSTGQLFSLTAQAVGYALPEPVRHILSFEDIVTLVRAHAAQTGTCCIEKISAPSIKDVIELVESLDS